MKPFDYNVWVELSRTAASFLISHFSLDYALPSFEKRACVDHFFLK